MDRDSEVAWCRDFIEHRCILRCPPGKALLLTPKGGPNTWQFYLPVATLNQEFAQRVAQMFWQQFTQLPLQLGACESGGVPLMSALQAQFPVNGFVIKKRPKAYGLKNWLEGVVDPELPVLLIDDIMGSGDTLRAQAARLAEFGLKLYPEAFVIAACKTKGPQTIKVGEHEIAVKSLLDADDFTRTYEGYVRKYNKPPQFNGTIV